MYILLIEWNNTRPNYLFSTQEKAKEFAKAHGEAKPDPWCGQLKLLDWTPGRVQESITTAAISNVGYPRIYYTITKHEVDPTN